MHAHARGEYSINIGKELIEYTHRWISNNFEETCSHSILESLFSKSSDDLLNSKELSLFQMCECVFLLALP